MSLRNDILQVFADLGKEITDDHAESIVKSGILDSLSILELVNALESRFDIFFEEDDLTLENFDRLTQIEHIIEIRVGEQDA